MSMPADICTGPVLVPEGPHEAGMGGKGPARKKIRDNWGRVSTASFKSPGVCRPQCWSQTMQRWKKTAQAVVQQAVSSQLKLLVLCLPDTLHWVWPTSTACEHVEDVVQECAPSRARASQVAWWCRARTSQVAWFCGGILCSLLVGSCSSIAVVSGHDSATARRPAYSLRVLTGRSLQGGHCYSHCRRGNTCIGHQWSIPFSSWPQCCCPKPISLITAFPGQGARERVISGKEVMQEPRQGKTTKG